jgi:hypothetical protein
MILFTLSKNPALFAFFLLLLTRSNFPLSMVYPLSSFLSTRVLSHRCFLITSPLPPQKKKVTAGFGRNAERQLHLYDVRGSTDIPRCSIAIDNGGGGMYLTFDEDTGLLIVAGKVKSMKKNVLGSVSLFFICVLFGLMLLEYS